MGGRTGTRLARVAAAILLAVGCTGMLMVLLGLVP